MMLDFVLDKVYGVGFFFFFFFLSPAYRISYKKSDLEEIKV